MIKMENQYNSVLELYTDDGYYQLVVGCLANNETGEGYAEAEAHTVGKTNEF